MKLWFPRLQKVVARADNYASKQADSVRSPHALCVPIILLCLCLQAKYNGFIEVRKEKEIERRRERWRLVLPNYSLNLHDEQSVNCKSFAMAPASWKHDLLCGNPMPSQGLATLLHFISPSLILRYELHIKYTQQTAFLQRVHYSKNVSQGSVTWDRVSISRVRSLLTILKLKQILSF